MCIMNTLIMHNLLFGKNAPLLIYFNVEMDAWIYEM